MSYEDLKVNKILITCIERLQGITDAHSFLRSDISSIRYEIESIKEQIKSNQKDNNCVFWILGVLLVLNLFT